MLRLSRESRRLAEIAEKLREELGASSEQLEGWLSLRTTAVARAAYLELLRGSGDLAVRTARQAARDLEHARERERRRLERIEAKKQELAALVTALQRLEGHPVMNQSGSP